MTPSHPTSALPRQLADFELLDMLGQGGMGTVFRARQVSLDRIVAVKILSPSLARDEHFILRFQREARISGRLDHPNIVQGIDVGLDAASGLWYFAMEFVDGPTLTQVVERDGPLSERRAIEVGLAIASALEVAGRQGIVHRDIKPDNILLNGDGQPKLADLGMARPISGAEHALTQTGVAVGTPYYMAPEQVRGAETEIDTRTDLYALGATLFCLVTGQPPFDGESAAVVMAMHLNENPPLAHRVRNTVSEGFGLILHKAMQKDRAKRFQSPGDFKACLEEFRAGGRGLARTAMLGSSTTRKTGVHVGVSPMRRRSEVRPASGRRGGSMPWLLLCGAAAFACFSFWFYTSGSRSIRTPEASRKTTPQTAGKSKPDAAPLPGPLAGEDAGPVVSPSGNVESREPPTTAGHPTPGTDLHADPLSRGLLAHWTFEVNDGQRIPDQSGHGSDLDGAAGVQFSDARDGKALSLNGGKGLRVISARRFELGGADFSLAAWLKTSRGGCILSKAPGDAWQKNGKIFYIDGETGPPGAVRFDSHSIGCASGKTSLLDDRWHHVAVTFLHASQEVRLYVDGREDGTKKLKLKPDPSGFEVRLGWGPELSFTTSYVGLLDDVRVYGRVLSAQEIRGLYSKSSP